MRHLLRLLSLPLLLAVTLLFVASVAHAGTATAFDPGRSLLTVNVQDLDIGYRQFAIFALPGEALTLSVRQPQGAFSTQASSGTLRTLAPGRWRWTAPAQPGHYTLDILRSDGARLQLEVFVMVPAARVHHGELNGYRIGHYPSKALDGLAIYRAPRGFIEVTPELASVHVSPHFTLGEFLCKQAGGYPKYLVLRRRLLLKLEALTAYLAARGIPPSTIHIMSGYRTPWYNARLGNVPYSRHQWGDAADIYIEKARAYADSGPLPAEGRDDYMDSRVLGRELAQLFRESGNNELNGGLGEYGATANHPPFVHVDARGFVARWSAFSAPAATASTGSR